MAGSQPDVCVCWYLTEELPPPPPPPEELGGLVELEPAAAFVFPEGYASRGYTREQLSKLEQRYFDDLEESKDAGKAQAVLDRIDLCHQADITGYEDITAFLEGRVTFEELLKDQAEMAEVRRKQCEQQLEREERRSGRQAVALELPGDGLACGVSGRCALRLILCCRACGILMLSIILSFPAVVRSNLRHLLSTLCPRISARTCWIVERIHACGL
jgi:hypothetical protein